MRFLTPEQRGSRFASLALPPDQAADSYHVHPALGDSTIHAAAIQSADSYHDSVPTRVPVSVEAFAVSGAYGGESTAGDGGNAVSRTAALRDVGTGVSDMRWMDSHGRGVVGISGLQSKAMPMSVQAGEHRDAAVSLRTDRLSQPPISHHNEQPSATRSAYERLSTPAEAATLFLHAAGGNPSCVSRAFPRLSFASRQAVCEMSVKARQEGPTLPVRCEQRSCRQYGLHYLRCDV